MYKSEIKELCNRINNNLASKDEVIKYNQLLVKYFWNSNTDCGKRSIEKCNQVINQLKGDN